MMKTYSRIRRKALEEAAAALQPGYLPPTEATSRHPDLPLTG
jgi:hypothetical protein